MMLRLSWARLSSFCGRDDAQGTTKKCSVRLTQRLEPRVIQTPATIVAPFAVASLEVEGAQARHHLVEAERARHRRLGACQAADAFAKPAGGPDRRCRD